MPAHTPGPWTAVGTDVKTPGHNSSVICWTGQPEVPLGQARANARLIAAAPDMLVALQRIASYEWRADRRKRGMVDVFEVETLAHIARAAIAKATGGTDR